MISLFSPAKVNLFLRVLDRRRDGFHELASLFQAIDLGDQLSVALADQDDFACSDASLPMDASNLVVKALTVFRRETGVSSKFSVRLEKRIPKEAGLGGGSSNAATMLFALNELCGSPARLEHLQQWGAELGSDVPFFFSEGTAFCRGRGELVRSLPPLEDRALWLVKPPSGVSTKQVFAHFDPRSVAAVDPDAALSGFYTGRPHYFNDLETAAFRVCPALADLKAQLLESGFESVTLTGSGTGFLCTGNGQPPVGLLVHPLQFVNRCCEEWYPAKRMAPH